MAACRGAPPGPPLSRATQRTRAAHSTRSAGTRKGSVSDRVIVTALSINPAATHSCYLHRRPRRSAHLRRVFTRPAAARGRAARSVPCTRAQRKLRLDARVQPLQQEQRVHHGDVTASAPSVPSTASMAHVVVTAATARRPSGDPAVRASASAVWPAPPPPPPSTSAGAGTQHVSDTTTSGSRASTAVHAAA